MKHSLIYQIKKIEIEHERCQLKHEYQEAAEHMLAYEVLNLKDAWMDLIEEAGIYKAAEWILDKLTGNKEENQ